MTKPPTQIPRVLVEPTIRLVFLRLALVATSATLYLIARAPSTPWSTVIIASLTLVHHLTSALGPKLVPLFTWMDLLLTAGEFGYYMCLSIYSSPAFIFSYSNGTLGRYLSLYTLTALLGCLCLLKVLHVTDTRGSTLLRRANILASNSDLAGDVTPWMYFLRVTLGTRLWKGTFPGEGRWIAALRGLLALAAIFGLLAFSIVAVVYGPLEETDLTPTREYRALQNSWTIPSSSEPVVWNLIVEWNAHSVALENVANMVTLKSIWIAQSATGFPCRVIENFPDKDYYETVMVFECRQDDSNIYFPPSTGALPDLYLRVNFTDSSPPARPPGSGRYIPEEAIRVYSAFTNNMKDVLATTRPILLIPGMHLMGVANLVIRKRFRTPELSAFGLFDVYDTLAVAEMVSIVPMRGTVSPDYHDPNISTLHITYQGPPGEWRVIQDYREKSVLNGLSAAGGLGSFVSLLCAVLFGTSLFSVLFRELSVFLAMIGHGVSEPMLTGNYLGTKPFSAFGILHSLENQRKGLASACKKEYPKLEAELWAFEAEENRGAQALLLNTLLDLDLIREQVMKPQSSVSSSDVESGMDGSPVAPTTRAERDSEQGA